MDNKNFHFLVKVANVLEKDIDTCGLANQIESLLKEIMMWLLITVIVKLIVMN